MIELGTRHTVVMQAAPFCFGPISTSLAIAERLREHDIAVVWLAEGTALELLRESRLGDYVVPFSVHDREHRRRYAYLVEEADLVVVNTDPEFAEFATRLHDEVLYVDILYWMWHELPAVAERCALYIYQDFVRSAEQIRRIGLPPKTLKVGPLIDDALSESAASRGEHLLVSVGGLHRPGDSSGELLRAYQEMVRNAVTDALRATDQFKTVYFTGGGIQRRLSSLSTGVTLHSGCVSRSAHQKLLASAKAAVLAPGLTGFYEAASARVPTFYLPPHNYSQYLQLESYKSVLPDNSLCDWKHMEVDADLPCFLSEEAMLEQVDAAVRLILNRPEILTSRLQRFLTQGWNSWDGAPAAALVGKLRQESEGGAERVAAEIVRRVQARTGRRVEPSRRARIDAVPLPKKATIEVFGGCQLRCPLCPTGNRIKPGRPKGPIAPELVSRVVDELVGAVESIDLFSWGEPFLHPRICEIIRTISSRGIRTVISSNLQSIPDPHELIRSGLNELIVSCHGMTQETYARYMVGGVLAKTLGNLDRILAAAGTDSPLKITLRFVVFAHNEHELPLAYERFRDTRVTVQASPMRVDMRDEVLKTTAENLSAHSAWVPGSSRFYDKDRLEARRAPLGCNLPFEEIGIDINGSVTFCCSSYDPAFDAGQVTEGSVASIWNGVRYADARRVVTGGSAHSADVICRTCRNNGYRDF